MDIVEMKNLPFKVILPLLIILLNEVVYAQNTKVAENSEVVNTMIDTGKLSKEKATELYKAELEKPSPVDIGKLKYYLTFGVDVKTADKHGWSIIHEAAFQGDTALINFCLQNNVSVNAKSITTDQIQTPLSLATDQDKKDAIKILLQHGASFSVPDGYGEQKYDSGNSYSGNFLNGVQSGQGTFYWANGKRYEGNWEKGYTYGPGAFYYPNGDTVKGNFEKGEVTGHGIGISYSGYRYEGDFEKGAFSGEGTLLFPQWRQV